MNKSLDVLVLDKLNIAYEKLKNIREYEKYVQGYKALEAVTSKIKIQAYICILEASEYDSNTEKLKDMYNKMLEEIKALSIEIAEKIDGWENYISMTMRFAPFLKKLIVMEGCIEKRKLYEYIAS